MNTLLFHHNAFNPLPVADCTVAHIHAEHFLEHLEYSDGQDCLGECYPVLEIGGLMRVVVPDSEKYMCAYARNDTEFFGCSKIWAGPRSRCRPSDAACNQMFHMWGAHLFASDFETLEYTVRRIGFEQSRNRATMIPRSDTASTARTGGALSRAFTSI
ncbi:MAG: hypothetical protein JO094_00445 [Hyphomicrobiales bacterium]|nr:hypothetical protein [Hyphomicrobiales bacterium]